MIKKKPLLWLSYNKLNTAFLGLNPTAWFFTLPLSNTSNVGIDITPYLAEILGHSSTLTLTTLISVLSFSISFEERDEL